MKTFAVCLFLIFFLNPLYAKSEENPAVGCMKQQLTPQGQKDIFNKEFHSLLKNTPWFKRVYLTLRSAPLRKNILNKCAESGGCSKEEIEQKVQEAVAKNLLSQNTLRVGGLIGGLTIYNVGIAGVGLVTDPLITSIIVTSSSFFIWPLLSPLIGPITSKWSKDSHAVIDKLTKKGSSSGSELNTIGHNTQAEFSLYEQLGRDAIVQARVIIAPSFEQISRALDEGKIEVAVIELANVTILAYELFKDINPHTRAIATAFSISLREKIKNPNALKRLVLARIQLEITNVDIDAIAYYQDFLEALFLKPSINLDSELG
ncbi:MAG: hypothetical protein KBD63_07750, partial [Bacteriovoracaceae bacterium]|nr:hypothetical protein [Bacteriovoracaceae bacterium]